jgi:ATP-dependent RNA helicase SUPV3L1/SUV3
MRPGPSPPRSTPAASAVVALLGPTNTGKTHQAIERMLEHRSGMIGLPLRLLAREVYDRVRARVGAEAVALVTGEERQLPARPRYWICTVEAMPACEVEFLAVDEIQLAAHHERGHIFTQRLLGWRGTHETWFLGADTIAPLLQALVPGAKVERKPRLSVLRATGSATIGQLPPRTAVVAFSAARVYELAERIKLKRGGAAVVLGALSPRTRNAQVAMYQAGEVDFLVATDAIGMGLNMNVDCVAFADLKKYDGRQSRALEDAEMAQIAGRAGRNRNDGRFCTLAPLAPLPFATQSAIEDHRFAALSRVHWRSDALEFESTEALIRSLSRRPFSDALILTDNAEDQQALARLTRRGDVQALAVGRERVQLLWQVCQIPDFRKLLLDDHFDLLAAVYIQLCHRGQLASDWVRQQVQRLDDVAGELDTLLMRMAAIRTWTFITHRTDWLSHAHEWQARTLAIEDKLSDALHEQLVSRFVDRHGRQRRTPRTAPPSLRPNLRPSPVALVKPDQKARSLSSLATLVEVVTPAAQERAEANVWLQAPDSRFGLRDDGRIYDERDPQNPALAKLAPGQDLLHPEIVVLPSLASSLQQGLRARLASFVHALIDQQLGLLKNAPPEASTRAWRAIMYALRKGLGSLALEELDEFVFEDLAPAEHIALRTLGFRKQHGVGFLQPLARPSVLNLRWRLLAPYWPSPRPLHAPRMLAAGPANTHALKRAAGYAPRGEVWVRLASARRRSRR